MSDPFLPRETVARITARVKASAQIRALDRLGIEYFKDAEGFPLVARDSLPGAKVDNIADQPRFGVFK